MNRRRLLGGLAGVAALASLPGCTKEIVEGVIGTCPSDPAESGGITWTPDIAHPVRYGFQEHGPATGAPRELQVFYPTFEGFTEGPPILRLCVTRWPVVLFLHGQPPHGIPPAGWHRKWAHFAAVLARCGFVVVLPNHGAQRPDVDFGPAVQEALRDVEWVRTQWSESRWVDKSLAVAGHSHGALLALRVAAAQPDVAAFVGLSGEFHELPGTLAALQSIGAPSFFMWGNGEGLDDLWDRLEQPKYAAVHQGEHFDYLPAQDTRGACPLIGPVAADLAALFIASNVRVPLSRTAVGIDLKPPVVQLTDPQKRLAGGHLSGLEQFAGQAGCRLDLRWKVNSAAGSRRLGP